MNLKKTLSLLMACMMAFALLTVSAGAVTITVKEGKGSFGAYRLLDLTTNEKADPAEGEDKYNYAYTVNPDYSDVLQQVTGKDNDADVLAYVNATDFDARAFADAVYAALKTANKAPTETADSGVFTVEKQGYYLIVETALGGDPDSYSLAMLDTAGMENVEVTSKEDVPTLEKKLVVDGNYQDADTVAKGNTVHYSIKVDLPKADVVAGYDTYKIVVHDVVSAGLSVKADTVTCKFGDAAIDAAKFVSSTEGLADGCSLEVEFADIKGFIANPDSEGKYAPVYVEYDCEVTESAAIGAPGNPNTAHLEFSNNPYNTSDMSETPDDKVTVFTFELDVNKVDANGEAVSGAEFMLQKKNAEGTYVDYAEMVKDASGSKFSVSRLDVGDYQLVETKTPAGYQSIDPVEFTVGATYDTEANDPVLKTITITRGGKDLTVVDGDKPAEFTVTKDDGVISTNIVNITGNRLPSTGGIGVYVLYAGGALLIVMAFVAVSMNRKKKTND